MIPCLGSLSKWFQKTWHLNRMSRVECYRNTALRWLKIPSAPTWWVTTFYAPANWHAVLAVRFMNQSWSVIMSQACFSFPLCICFFESFFTIFGALMHECFPCVFLHRVFVLSLWSKNGSINRWHGLFRLRNIPRRSWSWRLMGRHGTQHPRVGSMAGNISWEFLLGVVF